MGFQTEVLIASSGDAQAIADSDFPGREREGFAFTGFDRVQLCTLLSLLKSGDATIKFDLCLDAVDVICSSNGDWPVVTLVNSDLVNELAAIASLDVSEFEILATSWAQTDEFEAWAFADVYDLLRSLGDLAQSGSVQRKCIVIWQSP